MKKERDGESEKVEWGESGSKKTLGIECIESDHKPKQDGEIEREGERWSKRK